MQFLGSVELKMAQDPHANDVAYATCHGPFRPYSRRGLIDCNHQFHKDCIEEWIGLNNRNCPVCQTRMRTLRLRYPPNLRLSRLQRSREDDISLEDPPQCGLCQANIHEVTRVRMNMICPHIFCASCIIQWTNSQMEQNLQTTCPLCRVPYEGEIRLEYPEGRRLSREMRRTLDDPVLTVPPYNPHAPAGPPPAAPQQRPVQHVPVPYILQNTVPRYPTHGIYTPPHPIEDNRGWREWIDHFGRDNWMNYHADDPNCYLCDNATNINANPLIGCGNCGFFWHLDCSHGEGRYAGPQLHHGEWTCGECRLGRDIFDFGDTSDEYSI